MILVDQLNTPVKNTLQLQRMICNLCKVYYTHGNHFWCFARYPNDAVAHNGGSRVYPQYDLLCLFRWQCDTFDVSKGNQLNQGRKLFTRIFRFAVFLAALGWLYTQIGPSFKVNDLRPNPSPLAPPFLFGWVLILLPVNLLLEIIKWHVLTSKFTEPRFSDAVKGVLVGNFYTLFTPNRIGDGIGRMHYLPANNKVRATYAFLNGSIAQSIATLSFGSLALLFSGLWLTSADLNWYQPLAFVKWPVFGLTLLILLLYIEPGWIRMLRDSLPTSGWIGKRAATLQAYSRREHALLLLLSVLRYIVFATQYYLVLVWFGFTGEAFDAYARIALIYTVTTLIPTVALAELGLRESMAVLMLPAGGISPEAAFSATFLLYLVNIAVPAAVGGLLFVQMKKLHNT